jgi:hypothetical protein
MKTLHVSTTLEVQSKTRVSFTIPLESEVVSKFFDKWGITADNLDPNDPYMMADLVETLSSSSKPDVEFGKSDFNSLYTDFFIQLTTGEDNA